MNNVLLSGMSLLICLSLAEIVLRLVPLGAVHRLQHHQAQNQPAQAGSDEIHPQNLYQLDPDIGWTLTPHFSGRFAKKNNFDIHVTANSVGLRDQDLREKAAGTFRILGLGDSFAFGWGVENEESVFKRLTEYLNRAWSAEALPSQGILSLRNDSGNVNRFEVINAGIPGYGTYEQLQLLRKHLSNFNPDLVILLFYEGNDYQNNASAPRQRILVDGYLSEKTREQNSFVRFLTRHSVLAAMIDSGFGHMTKKSGFRASVEKTKTLLKEMQSFLQPKQIPLVVVLVPDQDPSFYRRPAWMLTYDQLLGGMTLLQAREELKIFCQKNQIRFYQLSNKFESPDEASPLRLKDTHFNPAGHALAAEEIFHFLDKP